MMGRDKLTDTDDYYSWDPRPREQIPVRFGALGQVRTAARGAIVKPPLSWAARATLVVFGPKDYEQLFLPARSDAWVEYEAALAAGDLAEARRAQVRHTMAFVKLVLTHRAVKWFASLCGGVFALVKAWRFLFS